MKRIILLVLSVVAALACMGALCSGPSNGPLGPIGPTPIDTTGVKVLDSVTQVSISVLVREWDKNILKLKSSTGASVYFFNTDTTLITDSTGYVNTVFSVDSTPFRYGYEVTKDGFEKWTYNNWEENFRIVDEVILLKE